MRACAHAYNYVYVLSVYFYDFSEFKDFKPSNLLGTSSILGRDSQFNMPAKGNNGDFFTSLLGAGAKNASVPQSKGGPSKLSSLTSNEPKYVRGRGESV